MSSLPYMPFYIADYMADAGHLPTLAHGAYFLLLANYWQRQGSIPADDFTLQGITKLSDAEWDRLRTHLAGFFQERDGRWHHKRVDAEIAKANEKIELARSKGKRSAEQRLNRGSTPAEPQSGNGSTIEAKGKANIPPPSGGGTPPPPETISEGEIERRLEQATGWRGLRNVSAISKAVESGADFEGRILPLARTVAAEFREQGRDPPKVWNYLLAPVNDPNRDASPCAREVATVFVPEGSPYWVAIVKSGKKESLLKQMLKKAGDGTEGIYWPQDKLPALAH